MEPKALPPAKISPAKLLKGSPLIPTVKRISAKSVVDDNRSLELGIVKRQVIQISDLIKTNTILKAKEEERKKKKSEKKRFAEREEKLEKPKEDKGDKIKLPSLPRLGFLDRIKKFLFNIFLGYISLRLLPYLPKLAGVVGTIVKVQDTVIDVSGKILNGLVSFVDKAYEVHDKTRKFLGNLGGENFTQAFDGFVGAMDKVITASIIAAIAFSELRDRSYPDDRGKKPGKRPKVTTSRGGETGKPNIRNPLRQRPKVTTGKGGKLRLPKGIKSRGGLLGLMFLIPDLIDSGMLVSQGRGKDGLRTLLSAVAGTVAGIGAYSATIAGAGALGVTGVGLPTAIALAIAGFAASSLAGNAAYNLADAALRKMGLVDKDPKTNKPYQYAGGGSVTRGGKYTGPIKRTIRKTPPRTLKVKSTEVKPGQSVGGKDKIKKIFPGDESKDQTKNVNPLGYMKSSYKTASSTPGLGGLIGILMKAQLGERPSSADYQSAADGLTAWMQRTVGGGIQRTVGAFAQGGEVDAGMFSNDADMKNVIAKALQDSVTPKVDDILNDLKKQLELKAIEGAGPKTQGQGETQTDVSVQGGNADFWALVAVASREDGDPQGWADVAQSIYNRKGSGAYGNRSIKEIITSDMQYEPTWRYPRFGKTGKANSEWLAIQDLASASAASGQSQDALKKVAAALLDSTLQKNARNFVQGRIDFRGYSVSGGIQRKSGDNYFGWYNNYKENKIAAVPNFGATVTASGNIALSGPMGTMPGNLSAAQQLASQFGLTMTSFNTGRHAEGSLHYKNRAMDFSNDSIGNGTPQQMAFAQEIIKRYGTSIAQLIYTPLGFSIENGKKVAPMAASSHYDHVHVAFEKGGKVHGFTRAILGEKGPEFVIDADSTRALEENYPGFLNALNKSNYQGALNVIRSYASYEQGATIRAIVDEKLIPVPVPVGSSQQSSMMVSIFDEVEDYMASSYKGK